MPTTTEILNYAFDASANAIKTTGTGGSGGSATEVDIQDVGGTAVTDSIPVGGVYNTTLPTLTDAQGSVLQLGARGSANVQLMVADSTAPVAYDDTSTDAQAAGAVPSRLEVISRLSYFNGTTWDRARGSIANGLHVDAVQGTTPTDRSGTITTGATAQQLMAANPNRRGFWIQNNSSEDLWINEIGTANTDQPSIKVPQDALYEAPASGVATGAISIIGPTTGQSFSSREW